MMVSMTTPLKLGWTYSHRQATSLGLDPEEGLHTVLSWNPNIVRLGIYWDESEPQPGKYTFSHVEKLLKICQDNNQPVLMSIGMKAPRWPEFYFPNHVVPDPENPETQKHALAFLQHAIRAVRDFSCISHWQVENEPLDPSGPENAKIPLEFLEQECSLVRSLDSREIVVNLWGNDVITRGLFSKASDLADIVGLDLYYTQHLKTLFGKNFYGGPRASNDMLKKMIADSPKPVWITELQAEPWEKDEAGYRSKNPQSMNETELLKNIQRAQSLGIETSILWGAEYWIWKEKSEAISQLLAKARTQL